MISPSCPRDSQLSPSAQPGMWLIPLQKPRGDSAAWDLGAKVDVAQRISCTQQCRLFICSSSESQRSRRAIVKLSCVGFCRPAFAVED